MAPSQAQRSPIPSPSGSLDEGRWGRLAADPHERRHEWFRYYSEKRIVHQWLQVHLLAGLEVERVLEIGPGLGLVSAMLANAGFTVTTLDIAPTPHQRAEINHIQADLRTLDAADLSDFDAIVCCETLEHLAWEEVDRALGVFRDSGARYVVMSVPYQGVQIDWRLYLNRFVWRHSFAFKKLKFLKTFHFDAAGDPWCHKWEVGYRGTSVMALEAKLVGAGFAIRERAFSSPCRSVFYLLANLELVP